jgi:hypothetical protein
VDTESVSICCECGKRLKFLNSHVGKRARCPSCTHVLRVVAHDGTEASYDVRGALKVLSGPRAVGEQFFLAGTLDVEVGELREADLTLTGSRVSRRHCLLTPTGTGWRLKDNNSTNGVFVNGERVADHELCDGDRVTIGEYELT